MKNNLQFPHSESNFQRRTFVKGLAAIMALQSGPLITKAASSKSKKLGLAIVGLGGSPSGKSIAHLALPERASSIDFMNDDSGDFHWVAVTTMSFAYVAKFQF